MQKSKNIIEKNKEKLNSLRSEGIELFPNNLHVENTIADITSYLNKHPDLQENGPTTKFTIAGRIMSMSKFGKTAFMKLRDRTGIIQAYVRKDKIGDEVYNLFIRLDVGDFVRICGNLFKTKTEEWTLFANSLNLICKSIRPLPEKFHGLRDPEKRYRQRYLDLLVNTNTQETFIKRSLIIQNIRSFLLEKGFLEVETPMMHTIPGGAEATPFRTHHKALNMELFLRIAPELYLKRLVVGGLERVFEINRNFRNEGLSSHHNPEFTMLEFYQAYAKYEDLMDMTEKMFAKIATSAIGSTSIVYQGKQIELGGTWKRISMFDALEKIGNLDPSLLTDKKGLIKYAKTEKIELTKITHIGQIISKLFETLVEPKLIQPTFVTGYPIEVSPLAKRSDKNKNVTERFELFIAGTEIANGFSELNDPQEQKNRFLQQIEGKNDVDNETHFIDLEYIKALEYGMPPTAGEGIGIDRLVMLLTNAASIREVILFPLMKLN